MLKKLEDTGHQSAMNKSAMKQVRKTFIEQSKLQQQQFEIILPKKSTMFSIKAKTGQDQKVQIILIDKQVTFALVNGITCPNLHLIHKFPSLYPVFRCDKGALKFIINGANVMCPGLTHPNATMQDVEKGTLVALYVEGKEHALAIGVTKMSTKEIRTVNKGIAVEVVHYLGDAFWRFEVKKK